MSEGAPLHDKDMTRGIQYPLCSRKKAVTRWWAGTRREAPPRPPRLPRCPYTTDTRLQDQKDIRWMMIHLCQKSHQGQVRLPPHGEYLHEIQVVCYGGSPLSRQRTRSVHQTHKFASSLGLELRTLSENFLGWYSPRIITCSCFFMWVATMPH